MDFWISQWISGFQFGFLPTVYEISFVTDPSTLPVFADFFFSYITILHVCMDTEIAKSC